MIGIQFTLASKSDPEITKELEPIGKVTKREGCRTLKLTEGSIEKIQASYSQNSKAVTAIKYFKDGNKAAYGSLLKNYVEWNFNENEALIGLHGSVEKN